MTVADFFLTAFDPSDLPGASIDPLGFDRGYTFLADKILPGLTNVANRPRYFGMLCAGVALAPVDDGDPPKRLYDQRRQAVLRLERLWALANVLAAEPARPAEGIRGIRYVSDEVARLRKHAARTATTRFTLLSRQEPYGVLGIYGAIAEQLRFFVDRKTFALTPDAGDSLAEAFMAETALPEAVKKAVRDDEPTVSISVLTAWGERAHISSPPAREEARCLADAVERDPVRCRTARLLKREGPREEESELQRIKRIAKGIGEKRPGADADLKDAFEAILAFEDAYRWTILGFERLLWLCRNHSSAAVPRAHLKRDDVLKDVCEGLPGAAKRLRTAFEQRRTEHLLNGSERIDDARRFVERAELACDDPLALCTQLLARHADVQRGKFDGGRRKMPWIESGQGTLALTSTRAGGLGFEAKDPEDISPHPYRLAAADALVEAAHA